MLPFFQPGKDIWFEPVAPASIRLGDVITYQEKTNALITHRVIKIRKENEKIIFITKGDNRFGWDPIVLEHQIIGKVTHIGNRNLNRFWWRWLGRLIAWMSYAQGKIYQCLINSKLNSLRHKLEEKGLFSKSLVYLFFRSASGPLFWITNLKKIVLGYRLLENRRRATRQGIQVETSSLEDVDSMLKIWNEVFPNHKTSVERFSKKLCNSPWFNPLDCFLIWDKKDLLGWTLISLRNSLLKPSPEHKKGFVEVFAITYAAFEIHAAQILVGEALNWFKKNKVKEVYVGPHRIDDSALGIPLTPLFLTLAHTGFQPFDMSVELNLKRSHYRPFHINIQELDIRIAQETGDLTATLKNQKVAYCRFLTDEQIKDYSDLPWVWSIAEPKAQMGYFFRLVVDQESRRRGIGTAMAMKAFELLFEAGCEEITISVSQNGFYEDFYKRFGFQRKGRYVAWKQV